MLRRVPAFADGAGPDPPEEIHCQSLFQARRGFI